MVANLIDGAKKGFLFGLIYAWADTMAVYVVTKVMMKTIWNPFTTTTLHMAGQMLLVCTVLGALLGAVLGRFLKGSWMRHIFAMCAGLAVVAVIASPEFDRIMALAFLGIGITNGVAPLLGRIAARSRAMLGVAVVAMAVIWTGAVSYGLVSSPAAAAVDPGRPKPPASAPNVLWVVYDTVTAGHTSLYGYPRKTTPNLDALAGSGAVFENAQSTASWTLPSHAAMFTGLFSSQHGCHDEHTYLDDTHTTLAQVLSEAGYDTAIFSGNPWLDDQTGVTRGFARVHPSWRDYSLGNLFAVGRLEILFLKGGQDKGAGESNTAFRDWLSREPAGGRPFFAFVNYMEAHAPYHQIPFEEQERYLPAGATRAEADAAARRYMSKMMFANDYKATPADRELAIAQYDGGIHYDDARFGELIDALREAGKLDNTLVIVNGDHGELFGEHDVYSHDLALYHPLVHVPLVLHYPGHVPQGVRIDRPVQLIDVFPTVLEVAGLSARLPPAVKGTSLAPLFTGGGDSARPQYAEQFASHLLPLMAEVRKMGLDPERYRMKSVQVGSLRFTRRWPDMREELFDLSSDPGEDTNLLQQRPTEAKMLAGLLDRFIEGAPAEAKGGAAPQMDAAMLERLKAMGYVQGSEAEKPASPPPAPVVPSGPSAAAGQ
jgi:arylsulfatase A-like enzyme